MSEVTESLLKELLEEPITVAIYGGGFKPPTKGHYLVVEKALQELPDIDELKIYVGAGVRDSITQNESVKIWQIYQPYLSDKVEVEPVPSPVKSVLEYAKDHPEEKIYWILGAREGDEEDFKDIEKRTKTLDKYPNIEVKVITTTGGVSGTKTRAAIKSENKEQFFHLIPDVKEKEEIWNILSPVVKEELTEGRYDSLTRTVVNDILNDWKLQFDGENSDLEFEEDYEMTNSKGEPINFELYAVLRVKETSNHIYKVDGGADPLRDPAYLEVKFQVDPRDLPQKWEDIYMDLTDVVRHEIEHMTQQGSNVISSKEMANDEILRNLINLKLLPKSEYFKLEQEIDAMLQGMYLKAKKSKVPFKDVINDYFDKVKLSKKDRQDILDIWKNRVKALSLPLNEVGEANSPIKEIYQFKVSDKNYDEEDNSLISVDYEFSTPDNDYRVEFNSGEYSPESKTFDVSFGLDKYGSKLDTFQMTGEGNALSILKTIIDIIKDFTNRFEVNKLVINPTSEKRGKVYSMILKALPSNILNKVELVKEKEEIWNILTPIVKEETEEINEVGEANLKPYKWKETDREGYFYYVKFTTDSGTQYEVDLENNIYRDKDLNEMEAFDIEFGAKPKGSEGYSSHITVNKGELYRVMATIADIIRYYVKKYNVKAITYSPAKKGNEAFGTQRDKLYKAFIRKAMPGTYFEQQGEYVAAILPNNRLEEKSNDPFGINAYARELVKETFKEDWNFKEGMLSLTKYMIDNGMNIKPLPKIKVINNDAKNASNLLGKTAYYDPNNKSITLFTMNRHPKDVLRSFSHEMIHHEQNLDGRLNNIATQNTNEDGDLPEIEREAYEKGNMMLRNWEDSIKNV